MTPALYDTEAFLRRHRLPASFRQFVEEYYLPLVTWLLKRRTGRHAFLLGINGAQGTGKSTLADFLKLVLESRHDWNVAVLSIDDFYLTHAERLELAQTVHPLFATRGVPGTHDLPMLRDSLARLRELGPGEQHRLPRFDKAIDDRADEAAWPIVSGPIDLIILEGWCVGSVAEPAAKLDEPVNALEVDRDADGRWRRYVNERLRTDYADVFAGLDALVFLQAPGFEAILRWRLEQEQKLAASAGADAARVMNADQVAAFIQYFERITRHNLEVVRSNADIVLELDEYHDCVASHYRE